MEHLFKGKERQWAKIIAMTWLDQDFKKRFITEPITVFKEHGIEVPDGLKVNIVEGKPGEINVTLPPRPEGTSGTLEELKEKLSAPAPFWPYFRA